MAVKIRLKRMGKIRAPFYRIVIADARKKRDGRVIEEIGKYDPKREPSLIEVDSDRAQHWLGVGAQPSEPVLALLRKTGDWQKFKGEPAPEPLLEPAAKKAKLDVFNEVLKEAHGDTATDAVTTKTPRKKAAKKTAASDESPAEAPAEAPVGGRTGGGRTGGGRTGRRRTGRRRTRRSRRPPPPTRRPTRPPRSQPRPRRRAPTQPRTPRRSPRPELVLTDALEHIVRGIVGHPDDVSVRAKQLRRGELLEVRVHPDDLGRVIGRAGRTATAIRTVVGALAGSGGARIDFVDVDRQR